MSDRTPDPHDLARAVLDTAHQAALSANGAELRRCLQEGRDLLRECMPQAADQLDRALTDLDTGALAELELLLEDVRRQLAAQAA